MKILSLVTRCLFCLWLDWLLQWFCLPYSIYALSDNWKASLTVKNVNVHLDALNIDVADNRTIDRNCLSSSEFHLNNVVYGKQVITFFKKLRILSKNWWSLDRFCYSPNNYQNVSHKITEFDKEKTRDKEQYSSQSAIRVVSQVII